MSGRIMTMRVKRGIGYTTRFVTEKAHKSRRKLRAAIEAESGMIAEQSMAIVPVDKWNLINTCEVEVKKVKGGYEGVVYYKSPYAVVQHETAHFKHAPGRTWKFLEKPLKAASRWFVHKVKKRLKEI